MIENTTKTENRNGEKTMLKSNLENEKIKRKYYDFLKESQGYSDATITAIKKSIYRYEEFTDFEDFSKFSKKKAIEFKKWIEEKKDPRSQKQISITTCYHYLRHLNNCFNIPKSLKLMSLYVFFISDIIFSFIQL